MLNFKFKIIIVLFICFISVSACSNAPKVSQNDKSGTLPVETGENTQVINPTPSPVIDATKLNEILIDKLDKQTDEIIRFVYEQSHENIVVDKVYKGSFSGKGNKEILAVFKLLHMPHAGGLDASVAALFDEKSLDIISQKIFQFDECKFYILKDDDDISYPLFFGSVTYQGYSNYTLGVWQVSKDWTSLLPYSQDYFQNSEKRFDLIDESTIVVSKPVYKTEGDNNPDNISWLKEYYLIWNRATHQLEEKV